MNQEISHGRDHLGENRRMIILRSLSGALMGALPLPFVDEWLAALIARGTISRVADSRGVDISEDAVRAVAEGRVTPSRFSELAGGSIALKMLARQWRKLVIAALAASRARAATRSFAIATLFDHYCARLHQGPGLDAADGKRVREVIDATTPRNVGRV